MPKAGKEAKAGTKRKKEVADAEEPEDEKARTVYLGGVPRLCQAKTISERFAKYGEVQDVQIPPDRRNKSKRIAFVTFASRAQAEAALAEAEAEFEGSTLKVKLSGMEEPAAEAPATAKVFVGGVGDLAEEELLAHFSKKCGKVQSLSKPASKSTKTKGRSRGFAILDFAKPKLAAKALELDGASINGHTVTVRSYTPNEKEQAKADKKKAKKSAKKQFRVVVQNFPKSSTTSQLKDHFEGALYVQLPKKKAPRREL
ncbi:unnamed protein product [Effrenium voratum]|uniref:RRM domain-containing protein n=1 Tax=Effrenium voratum TaxID=2562239 RepID=A0AA36HTN0_9DINO|nr:unnamed protein product [Effrenium voratum]